MNKTKNDTETENKSKNFVNPFEKKYADITTISVCMKKSDLEIIKEKAKKYGTSRSKYITYCAINHKIK